MTNKQDELLPCPFCGGTPKIVKRDVQPQGDPWYGKKIETFVLCDCGACLFDEGFHEGFSDEGFAASSWNTRPTPQAVKRLEEGQGYSKEWCMNMAKLEGDSEISAGGIPHGLPYGIIDPDYARVFSKVRCTAWMYGYATLMHGSFTRDLDILLVPWTEYATPAITPERLIKTICGRCNLEENGHPPSNKPHGRISYTLMFKEFGDPRFIDIGFMPQATLSHKEEAE